MRVFKSALAAAAIAIATTASPAQAALTLVGSGGTSFSNPPGTGTCTQTSTTAYLSCVGYSGNLLNNASIDDINTALDALVGGSGYSPNVVWSALDPTKAFFSGSSSDATGTITFSSPLSGMTILGVHFGGANSGASQYTNFYLLNFTSPTSTLSLNRQGFSDAVRITAPPAVPEPATWAMMLLGFGGVGMAMRRSRRGKNVLMQVA